MMKAAHVDSVDGVPVTGFSSSRSQWFWCQRRIVFEFVLAMIGKCKDSGENTYYSVAMSLKLTHKIA